jgi:hypothetical protein
VKKRFRPTNQNWADRFQSGRTDKSYVVVIVRIKLYSSPATPSDRQSSSAADTPTNDGQIKEVRVAKASSLDPLDSVLVFFSHTNHNQNKKAHRNGIKKPKSAGRTRSLKGVRWQSTLFHTSDADYFFR